MNKKTSFLTQFRHTGLVVHDLKKALDFYEKLGLKTIRSREEQASYISQLLGFEIKKVTWHQLGFEPDNIVLELLKFDPQEEIETKHLNRPGFTHIALTIDNVDAFYKQFKDEINFVSEPLESPDGEVRLVFCKDPEGNFVELVTLQKKSGS